MNSLEQDALNVFALAEKVAAALVTANNPNYAGIISTVSTLTSTATSALGVTPAAASNLPQDVVTAVAPTASAITTLTSKTATSAQKATALTAALSSVEVVGEDIWGWATSLFTHPSAAVPAATPTPPAAS